MSIPGAGNPLLLGGAGGYKIERSLRFNSADSAYLSRTPASAGNRKTWTWSGWIKRSEISATTILFSVGLNTDGDTGRLLLYFGSDNKLAVDGAAVSFRTTTAVYRDPSAWYHVLISVDTTLATANSRIRLYINGSEITTFDVLNNPSQNADTGVNRTSAHNIGRRVDPGDIYANYYLAEVHFIDGQALTPSSFGETDINGVWQPKAYTGSYGTNGFKLAFADNSAATATTLGKDTSGNGNNWTPNNLSVTAGAGNDSLVDTPTSYGTDTGAGGEVRGNYCTLNPLDTGGSLTLANGNLDFSQTSGNFVRVSRGTIAFPNSGKWYFEYTPSANYLGSVGIAAANVPLGSASSGTLVQYQENQLKNVNGTTSSYGAAYGANDVIGVAFDVDASQITFYKNNASQGSIGATAGVEYFPAITTFNAVGSLNFGQRPFAYTAPSGFKALCTQNLPAPTVAKPSTVMNVVTWTGNGNTGAGSITGVGFQPDLVWSKIRPNYGSFNLNNSIVGGGANKSLASNNTDTETSHNSDSTYGYLSSFDSDGFSYFGGSTPYYYSGNGYTYVAWCWDAGSSTVTNTQGSIAGQVRANASAGFSIVTYTGTGANATVGHGLGVAPRFIILKSRSNALFWYVYAAALNNPNQYLLLNATDSAGSASVVWNNTAPTSTTFSIGTDAGPNTSGATYVAYCFAPVAGYSSFGSYIGNQNVDGPFVYTGFRPRYLLVKGINTAGYAWTVYDTARNPFNTSKEKLFPNASGPEDTSGENQIDLVSNGFKMRTGNNKTNDPGVTYIYAAFAEAPFQYARAR